MHVPSSYVIVFHNEHCFITSLEIPEFFPDAKYIVKTLYHLQSPIMLKHLPQPSNVWDH